MISVSQLASYDRQRVDIRRHQRICVHCMNAVRMDKQRSEQKEEKSLTSANCHVEHNVNERSREDRDLSETQ